MKIEFCYSTLLALLYCPQANLDFVPPSYAIPTCASAQSQGKKKVMLR